ncbi:serine/threonine-protein kinase [Streptomyces sp. XD-27]|uniref:serine/threonine-protein kinase n=1 Tax=Streptomyces sp. XD-27 TaxID=3062779 RepID=UPI0026F459A9|nr:serine/threonine-protein kinase [Streptomyces sp. XD-27]WKX70576.1 serine/threonine-protein kinase [Streptomyces sp. XD-27]
MRRGEKVGRYRLTEGPVNGGRGEVWFAVDEELGRPVVLKRALYGGGGDDGQAAAFDELMAEARALARFSHPNVVTLYGAERQVEGGDVTLWLVMEHVSGGSLDAQAQLPPKLAAHIGAQIAHALAALHAEGIVHCDVKPSNIVITDDRVPKLADFGAAYRVDGVETITPNGPVSLTPAYASPEAFRGQPERASDVFSLGATVYALVAGEPPPRGSGRAVRTDAMDPAVEPLREVLTAMLRYDARARPTAAEVRGSLTALAGAADRLPTVPLDQATVPLPPPRRDASQHDLPRTPPAGELPRTPSAGGLPQPPSGGAPSGGPKGWRRIPTAVRRRSWRAAGIAVAGTALVITSVLIAPGLLGAGGGGGAEDGHGGSASRPGAPAPGAAGVFGDDPRTADPCALLKPAAFERFGETDLDEDYGNFDRCDVVLLRDGTEAVDVQVDFDSSSPPEPAGPARTEGRVSVVADEPESDGCTRLLSVDGVRDTVVRISANLTADRRMPLCRIADAATDVAVDRLNKGELARRSLPSGSLANEDACAMLDTGALAVVPGVDARDPDPGFGGWSCDWFSTTSDIEVELRFNRPGFSDADNSRGTRLHGRRAVVLPGYDGEGSCTVQVAGPSYTGGGGARSFEAVQLSVRGARSKDRPCAMATDLIRSAAEALP